MNRQHTFISGPIFSEMVSVTSIRSSMMFTGKEAEPMHPG